MSIQALIVFSLVTFSIETLPGLSDATMDFLAWAETISVIIFSTEYVLRVWVADRKIAFVFSFFGIIDLLAILPFYLSTGVDLRAVRSLRMLRLIRILKLARYTKVVRRFQLAFRIAREEIIVFLFTAAILIYLSAVGIYHFEHEAQPEAFASVFHSLWWATATLTTVGYGDVYPVTLGGRIFTFLILMLGLGVVAMPAGLMATALEKAREEEKRRED